MCEVFGQVPCSSKVGRPTAFEEIIVGKRESATDNAQ